MTRFPAMIRSLLLVVISVQLTIAQQSTSTEPTGPVVFQVNVNGKDMQFNTTTMQAYKLKEEGSITIIAQTSTDILNSNIVALSITPVDTTKRIAKRQYKVLREGAVSDFTVRAEYSSFDNGNGSSWWSDGSPAGGGSISIDEISASRIKGRFTFTGVLQNEDGVMNPKNLVKLTHGAFDLPLELRSTLDLR